MNNENPSFRDKNTVNSEKVTPPKAPITKKLGDAIEKFGDNVEHHGMKKVGDAIEKFGDKIEHSGDNKKTASKPLSSGDKLN